MLIQGGGDGGFSTADPRTTLEHDPTRGPSLRPPPSSSWTAAAFAQLKSVIVTGMKNQVRFIRYGIEVVRAKLRGERLPLPLTAAPDTS